MHKLSSPGVALLAALALGGCANGLPGHCAPDAAGKPLAPSTMVSAQSPPGVYGISIPDAGFQPANSFPPGAATVDGRCM